MIHDRARRHMTPRRRAVLYLRAAGWDYKQIADKLGITLNVVRKDIQALHKLAIPGLSDGEEPATGYRLTYALGLMDGGAEPQEVPDHMDALLHRAEWLLGAARAQEGTPFNTERTLI